MQRAPPPKRVIRTVLDDLRANAVGSAPIADTRRPLTVCLGEAQQTLSGLILPHIARMAMRAPITPMRDYA